jgi:hypothetical protein
LDAVTDDDLDTFSNALSPYTSDPLKYKMLAFSFNWGGKLTSEINACYFTYEEGGTSKGGCNNRLKLNSFLVDLNPTSGFYYDLEIGENIDG